MQRVLLLNQTAAEVSNVKSNFTLRRGCLHTGQRVTRFLPQRIHTKDATARHAAVYGSQAGSLGYIAPLLDQAAEPLLQKLQRQMVLAQPQAAGLNPAAFRCTDAQQQSILCSEIV